MNPIVLTKQADGTYLLTYFGKEVGLIRKAQHTTRKVTLWRALSVYGEIRHCYSLNAARNALMSIYH
jgi:hypothetical protein